MIVRHLVHNHEFAHDIMTVPFGTHPNTRRHRNVF